jgi:hypothetical protein
MTDSRTDVLETVWEHVVERFREQGFAHPADARLSFDPTRHDSCRHFAATTTDGAEVLVAPALADMPYQTMLAILAHEAGHVEDLCCPGVWWFRNGRLLRSEFPSKGARKLVRAWEERSDDEVERVADALAEVALGQKIGYVGHSGCLVQFVGRGKKRPTGLR